MDTITDFTLDTGGDVLDLHAVLSSFGDIAADTHANAFSDGYLTFTPSGSSTFVQIDNDGGGDSFVTLVTLQNVLLQQSDTANYVL